MISITQHWNTDNAQGLYQYEATSSHEISTSWEDREYVSVTYIYVLDTQFPFFCFKISFAQ